LTTGLTAMAPNARAALTPPWSRAFERMQDLTN
jgi:hypothetical protein